MTVKVAVLSYNFSIENQPHVNGITRYLVENGFNAETIVAELKRRLSDNKYDFPILALLSKKQLSRIRQIETFCKIITSKNRNINRISKYLGLLNLHLYYRNLCFKNAFQKIISNYQFVVCIEMHSLIVLTRLKYDMKKVIYVSLEMDEFTYGYFNKKRKIQNISACSLRFIQSKERAELFNRCFGTQISFFYMPVSLAPIYFNKGTLRPRSKYYRIIYSGSFCRNFYLEEFIRMILNYTGTYHIEFVFKGPKIHDRKYLEQLIELTRSAENITFIDQDFDIEQEIAFLNTFDIGLALYNENTRKANEKGYLFASSKIATYLWAGLPVLTNLNTGFFPEQEIPFLHLDKFDNEIFENAMDDYFCNYEEIRSSTYKFADNYYNVYKYLTPVKEMILAESWKNPGTFA